MRTSLNSSETEVPSSMALFAFVLLYFVFLNCLSISEVSHYFKFFLYIIHTYFIFRGHGNKSCNLSGSLPSQYFPISAHGPSTSQIPLPFFINIPRFAGWQYFYANTSVTTSSQLMNPLLSLSQITLVDKKILVSE